MKVLSVKRCVSEIIETDISEFPTYRRHSADCWEILMGQSWEDVYNCSQLEEAYLLFKRTSMEP